MPVDVVALARALLRCRSVTPDEGGALALIADLLARHGFAVERPVFSSPGQPPVENLFARRGTAAPCLVFAGHTDVVPSGDPALWRHDPFAGTVEDGILYGRGAVDMKGAVAASLAAALDAFEARPDLPGSVAFLITGDEEGPAVDGTAKLLGWAAERGHRFDGCVLGEPTNPERLGDAIKVGRRGSLTARLLVKGTQGHVAYPHLVSNPIPRLARIVAALDAEPLDAGTDAFDPSGLQFTTVDVGNPSTGLVPAEARAVFNVRFNDRWDADTLAEALRERVAHAAGGTQGWSLVFDPSNSPAFRTEPSPFVDLVRAAVEAETGRRPALSTSGGTSDARFIKAYCPVVEFGLVGRTMHAVDEAVPIADLLALTRIYRGIVERYFAHPSGRAGAASG